MGATLQVLCFWELSFSDLLLYLKNKIKNLIESKGEHTPASDVQAMESPQGKGHMLLLLRVFKSHTVVVTGVNFGISCPIDILPSSVL